jgi:hypothetical protein
MIVLQDASLASVWEEVAGLRLVQPHHHLDRTWGDRRQHFWWRPGLTCPAPSPILVVLRLGAVPLAKP